MEVKDAKSPSFRRGHVKPGGQAQLGLDLFGRPVVPLLPSGMERLPVVPTALRYAVPTVLHELPGGIGAAEDGAPGAAIASRQET